MRVDPLQILTKLAAVQNIPTRRVTPPFEGLEEFDYGLRRSLDPQFDWQEFGQLLLDSTPENTLLLVEGTFELHFALFRIPDEKNTVFLIGPWTVGPRTPSARKWVRRYLGEAGEAAVQEYYNGVKILEASDFYGALRVVVDTMFGCTVPVQELKEFLPFQFHPDTRYFHEPEFQKEIPVTMLEQRYESENRILDAVARGDEEAAIEAMHQHSRFTYGGRFEGTLYQQKNKMIVLNTLLRKAIEPSKVHPYYIDAISSKYSRIIEEANEVPNEMMWQMTRDYCAYVRRYSLKEYSPAVQKVMNYVNLNVAEPLTLKSLAAMCFISPSYLSHPYYIDAISSKYSHIIEEANEVPNEMMWQMTRDYCAYVRRYSLKEYSPAVQKVMNYVNLNVAEPLTLKSLAAMCFISPSYLSALFKQETGSTLIDYINTQRVNRAAQLLVQNNHTIAAVAEEVGILDVNYFTKIFKKTLGVTPTRYRREHKEK